MKAPPRQRSIALFGAGLLVPLLGGGNVLVSLEPEPAIRYLALAFVALAGFFVATRLGRVVDPPAGPTAALVLLVCWWSATQILRASGPRAALEAEGLFCAALLYALLSWQPPLVGEIRAWIGGLMLGTLVTAAYGQYQYWMMFPRLAPLIRELGGTPRLYVNANFYNSNCYAAFLAAVILLVVGFAPQGGARWKPFASASAVTTLVVTLLLSQSRATFLLLAIAAVAFALGSGRRLTSRQSLAAAAALVVAASALLAKVSLEELWQVGWRGRVAIWQGGLRMIAQHWLLGVGLGRFWDYFEQYRIDTYYTRYPHNFLIEVFAELGIVGAAALLGWLVPSLVRAVRGYRRGARLPPQHPGRRGATAVMAAVGLLTIHGLLDIDWHAPANPILLFALLGIGQHLDRFSDPEQRAAPRPAQQTGAP